MTFVVNPLLCGDVEADTPVKGAFLDVRSFAVTIVVKVGDTTGELPVRSAVLGVFNEKLFVVEEFDFKSCILVLHFSSNLHLT